MALLNITNFDDHPQDPLWMVFRFQTQAIATEFTDALREQDISFEQDTAGGPPFLVAVKQRHREPAVRANYTVLGRHRPRFIADGALRWSLLALVAVLLLLALAGKFVNG